jgi:PKHD-type hydroxylase
MKIFKVFDDSQLIQINSAIRACKWIDGKKSAEAGAKYKKSNQQITSTDKNFQYILKYILEANDNINVKAYTYFKKLIDPRVAKYSEGDHYDWHIDASLLGYQRTDLSFTIFLSRKDEYDGGEVLIKSSSGILTVKGNAGEMLVYPSGLLHKVNPVSRGDRTVVIGWLTSHVKIEEYRTRLFDIATTIGRFHNKLDQSDIEDLNNLYHQLVRDFSS